MYVLTLAMLVEGSHRILDSRNMVLITGKAFTILGLVVKWSDLRIQRCTAMNAGSATGSHGARYIRVQNSDNFREVRATQVYRAQNYFQALNSTQSYLLTVSSLIVLWRLSLAF